MGSRVLLVGKGAPDRGGIAAFLETLLASELQDAHDLDLLNLTRDEVPQRRKLTGHNIQRMVADARAVWGASKHRDVVHVHSALARHMVVFRAGLLALVARARGCRVIVHAHSGRVEGWFTTRPRRWAGRLALRPANHVVAVAEGGRAVLSEAIGAERVRLIENGVDPDAFRPAPRENALPTILYAGGLTPRKGVIDLLEASEQLRERGVDHEVVLAGGMPDEGAEAAAQVRAAVDGHSHVRLLGPQPHERMPEIYRRADVFCLPSWGEAMPLSVLEAMASGLPVVATEVGDVPRAVREGVTGYSVPPRRPDALADSLERLLRDGPLRRRLGSAARKRAEADFSAAHTVRAIDQLYRQLEGLA